MNLRETVALMRELGVTEYEYSNNGTSFKVCLGNQPWMGTSEEGPPGREQGPVQGSGEEDPKVPSAYDRLPAQYRNLTLYGGRLPKLDG